LPTISHVLRRPLESAHNPGVTELVTLPDRGHSLGADHGWADVAGASLDFLARQGIYS